MTKYQEIMLKLSIAQITAMAMLSENLACSQQGNPVKYNAEHFKKLVSQTGAFDVSVPTKTDGKKTYMKDDNVNEAYHVRMTESEYDKLVAKFGIPFTKRCIEKLGNHKMAGSKKYASDYRAILKWVVNAVQEEGHFNTSGDKNTGGRLGTDFGMQSD